MTETSSRVHATGLVFAGIALLVSVLFQWRAGFLLYVPGAGTALHLMYWASLLAAPVGRVVIAIILLRTARHYYGGWLRVPVARTARLGIVLTGIGVIACVVFIAWQIMVLSLGPDMTIFRAFGPANFWFIALCTGIALVEGSRLRVIALVRRQNLVRIRTTRR